jgi:hypothetical protein
LSLPLSLTLLSIKLVAIHRDILTTLGDGTLITRFSIPLRLLGCLDCLLPDDIAKHSLTGFSELLSSLSFSPSSEHSSAC